MLQNASTLQSHASPSNEKLNSELKLSSPPQSRQGLDESSRLEFSFGTSQSKTENPNGKPSGSRFEQVTEDGRIVKEYFHDLLLYINKHDATLANDCDGELAYFMRQMPSEELDMTFEGWVEAKLDRIKTDFVNDSNKKLEALRLEFGHAQDFISSLDDEDMITTIARNLDLL